jgi:hypothetical protein
LFVSYARFLGALPLCFSLLRGGYQSNHKAVQLVLERLSFAVPPRLSNVVKVTLRDSKDELAGWRKTIARGRAQERVLRPASQ